MKYLQEGGTNVFINKGHMNKMAAMPIPFKNLLLQNWWTDLNDIWHVASVFRVLQYVYNHDPGMTFITYFTARST